MLRTFCSAFFLLSLCCVTFAQQESLKVPQASATPLITAASSAERVRFAAPSTVVQMHLQVYADSGQVLFDTTSKGNVLDWTVQDGSGEHLRTGSYLCVVTVKSLNGKLGQRIGEVSVEEQRTDLRAINLTRLTAAQQREIGPVEEDAAISVLEDNEAEAATTIGHNGEEGQIARGRGALSFRIGDFFSGKDREQMRLTAEGNLGIGITNPAAKLDVDGLIRASQGIVFPDGSIQYSASRKIFGAESLPPGQPGQSQKKRAQGDVFRPAAIEVSGIGTTGKIVRWQDGPNGVLADSNFTEVSGAIGVNGSPNTSFRLDVNGSTRIRGSNPGFNLEGLSGNVWLFQTVDDNGRFRLFGQNGANPGVERLTIDLSTGNLGIGATVPAAKLDVAGTILASGDVTASGNIFGSAFMSSALRQELPFYTANIIGGFIGTGDAGALPGNRVTEGVVGATIGGGGFNGTLQFPVSGSIVGNNTNRVNDWFGTVGGGFNNSAGSNDGSVNGAFANANWATVGGGKDNVSNSGGATVGGGEGNTASGDHATVGGGDNNTASGDFSVVPGGRGAKATHYGEMAFSSNSSTDPGSGQTSVYTLRETTTSATTVELFLDGDGGTHRITVAAGRALVFDILVVAKASGGNTAGYIIRGVIKNAGGNTSFVGGTPNVIILGEDNAAWDVVVEADNVNNALVVKATGVSGTFIDWVASVRTSEVKN